MYMQASEASELRTFWHFSHSKTAISFNIFCWYFKYVSETYLILGVK